MLNWLNLVTVSSLVLAAVLLLTASVRTRGISRFVHTGHLHLPNHLHLPSHRTVEEISTCAELAGLSVAALGLIGAIAFAIAMAVR
jgi:hypothetical protein